MQNDPSLGLMVLIPASYLTAIAGAAIADVGNKIHGVRSEVPAEVPPLADPRQPVFGSRRPGAKPRARTGWRRIPPLLRWGLFVVALGGFGVAYASLGSPATESGCSGGTVSANAIVSS